MKKSTIPRAGKGLFVKRDFANNEKIGDYSGQKMSVAAFEAQVPESAYGYRFRGKIIDAKKTQSTITRYANDARDHRNNSQFVDGRRKVALVATKPIKSGSEVFADYGATYWAGADGAKGAKRKRAKGGVKAVKRGAPVGALRLKGGAFRPMATKSSASVAVKTALRLKGGRFRPVAVKRGSRV